MQTIHPRVFLFEQDLARIAWEAAGCPKEETGGSLFGHVLRGGDILVYRATGPGPAARHARTSYHPDAEFMLEAGRRLHPLEHVGEWHSHHELGLREPSEGDLDSVVRALEARGWDELLVGIATVDRSAVSLGMWLVGVGGQARPCELVRLTQSSPGGDVGLPGESVAVAADGKRLQLRQPAPGKAPWYATGAAAERLAREVQALQVSGYDLTSSADDEEVRLELEKGSERLLVRLRRGFPKAAPKVERSVAAEVPFSWSAGRLIAEQLGAAARPQEVIEAAGLAQRPGLTRAVFGLPGIRPALQALTRTTRTGADLMGRIADRVEKELT